MIKNKGDGGRIEVCHTNIDTEAGRFIGVNRFPAAKISDEMAGGIFIPGLRDK